ncbi:MAG: hypothetical protein AABW68_02230 [archaeon]
MNTHQLLITAIIALAIMGLLFTDFASLFMPLTALNTHAPALLLEAQGELGQGSSITLSLKEGDTLSARNLDSRTRTIAFACSGTDCCPDMETSCPFSLSVTPDRMRINEGIKTTLTARCETVSSIHACTLYIGEEPAQLDMGPTTLTTPFTIQGKTDFPIHTRIRNNGKVDANEIHITAKLTEEQIIGGIPTPTLIGNTETTLSQIEGGEEQEVSLAIPLTKTGAFQLTLRVEGEGGGYEEEEYDIIVEGTNAILCARDTATKENPQYDGIDGLCRKKVFCTGCAFAYDCRDTWKKQSPLTQGGYYDPDDGTPEYAYQLWPSNGTC